MNININIIININININIDINLTININININIVINLLAQQMQPEPPWDGSKMDGMSYEQDRKSVSLAVRGGGGRGDKGMIGLVLSFRGRARCARSVSLKVQASRHRCI